jgi:hypothetical protein
MGLNLEEVNFSARVTYKGIFYAPLSPTASGFLRNITRGGPLQHGISEFSDSHVIEIAGYPPEMPTLVRAPTTAVPSKYLTLALGYRTVPK